VGIRSAWANACLAALFDKSNELLKEILSMQQWKLKYDNENIEFLL